MLAKRTLGGSISSREGNGIYGRNGSGVSLAASYPPRATWSDTQTTMLIQVHLRTRGEGIWLRESGAVWLSTSINFTDVLSTSFAVGLTKSDAVWLSASFADVRMCRCAGGSRRAVRNWLSLARRAIWEGNYQRLNPRMRQAISSGLRTSMSKAVRWLSSAAVARRFRTSARSTKSSFFT